MTNYGINFNDHKILIPRDSFGDLDPHDPLSLKSSSAYEKLRCLFTDEEYNKFRIDCSKSFLSRWFRAEIFVAEVYFQLCKLVSDQETLETFKEIIDEELTHANIAYNVFKHTYNEELEIELKPVEITDISYTAFTMVFYETMATSLMHTYYDLTQDDKIRKLFKKILADDVGHANNLINLYKSHGIDRISSQPDKVSELVDDCISNPGDFWACFNLNDTRTDLVMDHKHLVDQSVQTTTFKKYFKKDINRWFDAKLV